MRETPWRSRIVRPLLELLRQGLTPEKIAFTIALGLTLGVTPVLGLTALLSLLAAMAFRLNLAAIQLVNWMAYPLQLALLVPLLRIGAWMFGCKPSEISITHILAMIHTNVFGAVATLWMATMHAIAAWLLMGTVATALLYLILVPVLRRMRQQLPQRVGEKRC
jgi:uncharacterized protein (DUF2062 family)